MKIEHIHIENYRALRNVSIQNIGSLAVFLGENGVGKSTLFDVFAFMKQCLTENVRSALQARGGYNEVHTRDTEGDIVLSFEYRIEETPPLYKYELRIKLDEDLNPVVENEVLLSDISDTTEGTSTSLWVLKFSRGSGQAIINNADGIQSIKNALWEPVILDTPDILAIKSLGQMKRFSAAVEFRRLIEDWFVSDLQISAARQSHESSYVEQLNRNGDNLANVTQYLHDKHPEKYAKVIQKMQSKIPGISNVESKVSEDGRILLRFSDGTFKDPFSARFVSDGTIKMFAYLIMLADPNPHKLLCIEEPENQLYPNLLGILAEEFREYTFAGGQVFISTHSPDFVNAVDLRELFIIKKKDGFSEITAVADNKNIVSLYENGDDKLGVLWQEGLF